MIFAYDSEQLEIKRTVEAICSKFDLDYWRKCDAEELFPEEFFQQMAEGA